MTSFIYSGACLSVCPTGKTYLTGDNKCIAADSPVLEAGFATRLSIYSDFKSITPYSIGNVQNNIAYSFAFKVFSGNSSSANFDTKVDLSSSMPWISVESASSTSFNLKLGYSAVVPAPPGKNQD